MNRVRALSLFSIVAFVLPLAARAADLPLLSPGWSLVPEECRDCACGFAAVMGMVQNLMNAGISVGVLAAVAVMTWAGVLYITTPTNPEARGQASKMLLNVVIGIVIVLSAWLIVDTVMKTLYSGADGQQGKFGPWNSILTGGDVCVSSVETRPLFSGSITAGQLTTSTGTGGVQTLPNGAGAGSCLVRTSGNCTFQNFIGPFGSEAVARQASQICYEESQGIVARVSTSDIMRNDPQRRAFSFGLFQINLTWHEVAGLKCYDAFRGKSYNAVVINESLYAQCVAAAKTYNPNVAEAVATYKRAGNWSDWGTAPKCGLAQATNDRFMIAYNSLFTRGVSLLP